MNERGEAGRPGMGELAIFSEEGAAAGIVSRQYAEAQRAEGSFVREAICAGALLLAVELRVLPRQNSAATGLKRPGTGLRKWLEDHCPEVNYNTAMGYKALAARCLRALGGGMGGIALLAEEAGGDGAAEAARPDAGAAALRDRLLAAMSRREVFRILAEAERGEAAEPVPPPRLARDEAAREIWGRAFETLGKRALMDSLTFLDMKSAKACLERVNEVRRALERRIRGDGE